jgi:hypothetical protein
VLDKFENTQRIHRGHLDGIKERIAARFERIEAGVGRHMMRATGILATIGALGSDRMIGRDLSVFVFSSNQHGPSRRRVTLSPFGTDRPACSTAGKRRNTIHRRSAEFIRPAP